MIEDLFARNVEWSLSKTKDDPKFFRRLANQQSPRYLWIGCSDSRVPANEIVGLDPGEMFVHRNIANVIHSSDMNLLAVLEFAVRTRSALSTSFCVGTMAAVASDALLRVDTTASLITGWRPSSICMIGARISWVQLMMRSCGSTACAN